MRKKIYVSFAIIIISLILSFNYEAIGDEISIKQIYSNMVNSFEALEDYSCLFVTIIGQNPYFAQLDEMSKEYGGESLPKEQSESVWIKNPNMMKTENNFAGTTVEMSVKRLEEGVYATYWYPTMNTVQRSKLPDNSWPAFPSPESITKTIKDSIEQNKEVTIDEAMEDGMNVYIISFGNEDDNKRNIYYVRKSDWMVYKLIVYMEGKLAQTSEWRDIKLNSGIDDSIFDVQIPKDAKVINEDFSSPDLKSRSSLNNGSLQEKR